MWTGMGRRDFTRTQSGRFLIIPYFWAATHAGALFQDGKVVQFKTNDPIRVVTFEESRQAISNPETVDHENGQPMAIDNSIVNESREMGFMKGGEQAK